MTKILVKGWKVCKHCLDIFQQTARTPMDKWNLQEYCSPKCREAVNHPDYVPRAETVAVVTAFIDRPPRKEVEQRKKVSKKRKRLQPAVDANDDQPWKMLDMSQACARFAEKSNLPVEVARKLWGFKDG